MSLRQRLSVPLLLTLSVPLVLPVTALSQDEGGHRRGRKYKAPPETSRIEVDVVKGFNGKPIMNAAVVFHPVRDGKDEGNLEVKTDPEGRAIIDVIPIGSSVRVQVIADGYATFADDYEITEATKAIHVKMLRPQAQISAYTENHDKESERKPGVQEPPHIKVPAKAPSAAGPATPKSVAPATPDTTTKPNE